MKKALYSPILFILLTFSSFHIYSQCGLTYYAGIGVANTGTTFATWANFGPGQYFAWPVLNGGSYALSTCGAPINTQITCWDASASSVVLYNDDNGPFCSGTSASMNNYVPNFTNYMYVQVTESNCAAGGTSSINLYLRQNNNLVFTSSNAAMCSGQTRNLTATPANVGSTPGGYGNPGTFSGTGVSGNVFTAPVVATPTTYTITYTFGYVSQTQTILVNPNPTIAVSNGTICSGNSFTITPSGASTYTYSSGSNIVSPVANTSYSITGTSSAGCVSSNTAISAVTVMTCTPAAALNFDGADDWVGLGAFSVNGTAPRTVEFWLKTANTGAFQNPFSSGTANNNQAFNIKVTPSGKLGFMGFNNDNYPSTGTTIADNTFHHVALSYNGTTISAYVDGNPEWTFPAALATTGTDNRIGSSNHAGNEQYFPGTIDELRVWNVARTQCEINSYKNCEIPTTATGLIANYHFNQGLSAIPNPAVTSLTDATGSYNGTLFNFALTGATSNWIAPGAVVTGSVTPANFTPTVTVNSGAICSGNSFTMTPSGATSYTFSSGSAIVSPTTTTSYTVTGSASGCTNTAVSAVTVNTCTPAAALDFDGANDQVNIGNTMNTVLDPLNKITVEAWVKPANTTGLGVIVGNYRNASNQMQFLLRRDLDQYAFWVDDGTGFKVANSLPASVVVGTWQHVAGVWDGSKLMIYVNGVLHTTTTGVTGSSFASTANPVMMGYNSINENFTGTIDEIRIWTVNRTQCEINTYKTCEIPTTASGLLANYHFNQGLAAISNPGVTTLTDASGNGYNGTLSNFGLTGATSNWVAPGGVTSGSVTPLTLPTSTISTSPALCNGGNGTATVTASGGTPAYTYSWSTTASTSTISSVAGVKTVTVTDANACSTSTSITIAQPTAVSTTTAVTNVLCNGGSTGSATVTASGGTGAYTYLWSTAATTSVITGQTAGVKTVTVTDANNCTTSNSVTITQPSSLMASVAVTTVACNGGSTGSATVTASSGTGAYTYLWSTAATTSVITGQAVGIKTATVTDANGCTAVATGTIVQPSAIVTSTAVTNVLCNGGSTGSATITATGGTAGYTYLWSTAATTSVIPGQTAGVKTYTVTDANSCTATGSVTITQPSALATSTAVSNVLCNGSSTGSSTVIASGGTAGYTYLWSTAATTSVITGQTAGVRTVTVTDANGCTSTNTVTITQPTALATTTAVTNNACFGGSTASATVTASGGTAGYTYLWSTAATTSVITGQTAGVKTVTVTDANGCSTINSITITQPATVVSSTTTVANASCFGGSNGTATITATGGTGGYTYLWSTAATTSVITGQTAGVKTVTVTDANGCTTSNSVTISQPATAVSSSTASSNVLCFSGSTGSATVTASGGTAGYTYLWSTAATTSVIAGQTAGVKTVTVTDANGCTTSNSVTISQPAAGLSATQTQTNVTCVINGRAAVSVSGGTPAYTYTWSPAGGNAATSTTLSAGTYTCSITDANGCTLASLFTITANTVAPVVAISGSTAICNGANTTLTASGATTYTWSTSATTSTINVNPSSTSIYSVTGTNSTNGCTASTSHTLSVNPIPTLTATASSTVICTSQSATLTASGAATYTWSTGSNATSTVVSPTVTTTYTLNGTSAAGCAGTTNISITVVNTPTVTAVSSSSAICAGSSATLTATGAITYSWSTGATTSSIVVNPAANTTYSVNGTVTAGCNNNTTVSLVVNSNPTVSIAASQASVCPGQTSTLTASGATTYTWNTGSNASSITSTPVVATSYTVTGSNAAGCTNTATQTIGLFPAAAINMLNIGSPSASVCAGSSATLVASGVSTYTWSTGSNNPAITISPSGTTTYSVNGTDLNGCAASNSITIGISSTPTLSAVASTAGICQGFSANLNVSGALSYTWSTGASGSTTSVSPLTTTVYSVSGTNGAGCVSTTTLSLMVYASPTVNIGADAQVPSGTTYQLNPTQTGATSYTWSPATYLSATNILNPGTTPSGDITYILTVGSANGCTASDTVNITVLNELVMANYMSPNGDGQNDTWKVSTPGLIKDYSVTIIDSYGKTVFSVGNNYNNEFDGKLGGQELPDGVYYYFIKDGNDTKFKGSITLTK